MVQIWDKRWDKILVAPQRGQKIIANQSKPILVIVSIKPFTRQSFRQSYISREIEWAVFTETAFCFKRPKRESRFQKWPLEM